MSQAKATSRPQQFFSLVSSSAMRAPSLAMASVKCATSGVLLVLVRLLTVSLALMVNSSTRADAGPPVLLSSSQATVLEVLALMSAQLASGK